MLLGHWGLTAQLICSSLHCETKLPVEQGGAPIWRSKSSCTKGSIVKHLEQRIKVSAILNPLFNSSFVGPLGQKGLGHQHFAPHCSRCSLSHNEGRSRSAVQSILCVAPPCPRGSLFQYQSEEQISCAVQTLCCSSLSQRQFYPYKSDEQIRC